MKRPSGFQVALLMVCGSLMAGFSCFHTADKPSSVLGILGFAAGLGVLGYAAIALVRRTPESPPSQTLETLTTRYRRPTLAQGFALAFCGFLLFFFSCGGAFISNAPFAVLGSVGMIVGVGFTIWGLVRFVVALGRRFSDSE